MLKIIGKQRLQAERDTVRLASVFIGPGVVSVCMTDGSGCANRRGRPFHIEVSAAVADTKT